MTQRRDAPAPRDVFPLYFRLVDSQNCRAYQVNCIFFNTNPFSGPGEGEQRLAYPRLASPSLVPPEHWGSARLLSPLWMDPRLSLSWFMMTTDSWSWEYLNTRLMVTVKCEEITIQDMPYSECLPRRVWATLSYRTVGRGLVPGVLIDKWVVFYTPWSGSGTLSPRDVSPKGPTCLWAATPEPEHSCSTFFLHDSHWVSTSSPDQWSYNNTNIY